MNVHKNTRNNNSNNTTTLHRI